MTAHRAAPLDRLESVELAVVEGAAALLQRRDRKYLVEPDTVDHLLRSLDPSIRVLEIDGRRAFRYESVYFDTPDLDHYLAAAHRRPRRLKVRTRAYLDAGWCALEVKQRTRRGITNKKRRKHPIQARRNLDASAVEFIERAASSATNAGSLLPTLTVGYWRITLFDPVAPSRVTIDTGLHAETRGGGLVEARNLTIVETKSAAKATPVDRLLWANHCRPTSFSKYGTLLAVAIPGLPANKWNRTLRTRFGWEPDRSAAAVVPEWVSVSAHAVA